MNPEELLDKLDKYARAQGMELNTDREHTLDLMQGLLRNENRYGYRSCPCRLARGEKERDKDIVCPCRYRDADVKEFGSCYCGLYVSEAWNKGSVDKIRVPERRPVELR